MVDPTNSNTRELPILQGFDFTKKNVSNVLNFDTTKKSGYVNGIWRDFTSLETEENKLAHSRYTSHKDSGSQKYIEPPAICGSSNGLNIVPTPKPLINFYPRRLTDEQSHSEDYQQTIDLINQIPSIRSMTEIPQIFITTPGKSPTRKIYTIDPSEIEPLNVLYGYVMASPPRFHNDLVLRNQRTHSDSPKFLGSYPRNSHTSFTPEDANCKLKTMMPPSLNKIQPPKYPMVIGNFTKIKQIRPDSSKRIPSKRLDIKKERYFFS